MKNALRHGLTSAVLVAPSLSLGAPLISASALDGGGLGMLPNQTGRAAAEFGFHTQSDNELGDFTVTTFNGLVGLQLLDSLELSGIVPFSQISDEDDSAQALGNITLGLNYLDVTGPVRFTIGAQLALPTSPDSDLEDVAVGAYAIAVNGYQHFVLRAPGAVGANLPLHLEAGGPAVVSLDTALEVHKFTSDELEPDDKLHASTTFAPGFGIWFGERAAVGVRLPAFVFLTDDPDDAAQVSMEPFVRVNLGNQGFLGFRATFPIDDPLKRLDFWCLHFGGGGAF